jgi:hypothetical protein
MTIESASAGRRSAGLWSLSGGAVRREFAAWSGMALGSVADAARLGQLGFVEICGRSDLALFVRLDAHRCSYLGMLAGLALARGLGARARTGSPGPTLRLLLHASAMCLGMAAGDLLAPALPGPLTPGISLLMMTLGMIGGTIVARALAGPGAGARADADAGPGGGGRRMGRNLG